MIDMLVAILLLFTIGYCVVLNNRLKRLKADEQALKATIAELITATEIAERAVAGLKTTAHECDRTLGERLRNAERCCADLTRKVNAGDVLIRRLALILAAARPLEVEAGSEPAPATAPDAQPVAEAARVFAARVSQLARLVGRLTAGPACDGAETDLRRAGGSCAARSGGEQGAAVETMDHARMFGHLRGIKLDPGFGRAIGRINRECWERNMQVLVCRDGLADRSLAAAAELQIGRERCDIAGVDPNEAARGRGLHRQIERQALALAEVDLQAERLIAGCRDRDGEFLERLLDRRHAVQHETAPC